MGYYVSLLDTNATIPHHQRTRAYRLACALNERNDLKTGGRLPRKDIPARGAHPDVWFAWMDWDYPETCPTIDAILTQLGFRFHTNANGAIVFTGFSDKTGAEQNFLAALAPVLVGADGNPVVFFDWEGEDDVRWRLIGDDGGLYREDITVSS